MIYTKSPKLGLSVLTLFGCLNAIKFTNIRRTICSETLKFKIGNEIIEIVQQYKYLGVYFTSNGLFTRTKAYIIDQANKAMFALLQKIKTLDLPYDIQIELFD